MAVERLDDLDPAASYLRVVGDPFAPPEQLPRQPQDSRVASLMARKGEEVVMQYGVAKIIGWTEIPLAEEFDSSEVVKVLVPNGKRETTYFLQPHQIQIFEGATPSDFRDGKNSHYANTDPEPGETSWEYEQRAVSSAVDYARAKAAERAVASQLGTLVLGTYAHLGGK